MSNATTKFHPILFSTPMIQAILEGKKTQTRRFLKPTPVENKNYHFEKLEKFGSNAYGMVPNKGVKIDEINIFPYNGIWLCPYEVGDILWVRETFFDASMFLTAPVFSELKNQFAYKADETFIGCHKWKPSIFMPREACRTFLKVKSIRMERLQDISEEDAQAEGAHFLYHGLGTVIIDSHPDWEKLYKPRASYKDGFHFIWRYINGEESWQFNPFVWVYEFEKIEKPESF